VWGKKRFETTKDSTEHTDDERRLNFQFVRHSIIVILSAARAHHALDFMIEIVPLLIGYPALHAQCPSHTFCTVE
jgi:uncharacterized membrane protein YjdF